MTDQKELIDWLNNRYAEDAELQKLPKYERLYQVILAAIRRHVLSPGDRLPPEQTLSKNMPLSLVTVRKCFAVLAQRGVISREHGRGTFVSAEEQGVSDLWHFRFLDPNGSGFMPIYNRILSRTIRIDGDVAKEFPDGGKKFVCVKRAVNIGSRFNCYSELFLPATRYARIMDESIAELERVNLKDILAQEFRTPTLSVDQKVCVEPIPERASEPMGLPAATLALSLFVTGRTFGDQPISFQRIWIPQTTYKLDLPASVRSVSQRDHQTHIKEVMND